MITVLLADDQTLIRAGFRAILDTAPDIIVVAEASNGAEAITQAALHSPDVILMDIRMPGTDGLEATRRIWGDAAGPRVIILTTYEADEYVYAALRAGASGFLVKDTEPVDLFHAIRVVAGGEALLAPRVTRRLIADIAAAPVPAGNPPPTLAGLTDREREVLVLVATGLAAARGLRRREARISDGLRAMHARGSLPAATDPDDLALALLAALQGGLLLTQLQRETRPLEVTLDAMLDRIQALTDAA